MWNVKNIATGIFFILLDFIAIRGVVRGYSGSYYLVGAIICTVIIIACFRNARK